MFALLLSVGCADRDPAGDSVAGEETGHGDGDETALMIATDVATGTLELYPGTGLVGTISDRDGDGWDDLLLSDGAVVAVPAGNAIEGDLVIQQYEEAYDFTLFWDLYGARDLDGDGVSEIFALYAGSQSLGVAVFPVGAQTIDSQEALWYDSYSSEHHGIYSFAAILDDVTGDGVADLEVLQTSNGGAYIGILQPPGDEASEWSVVTPSFGWSDHIPAYLIGVDDIDGDGLRDVVQAWGDLWVFSGSALDGREDPSPLATLTSGGDDWELQSPLHSGDFDGDGKAEIAVTGPNGVVILSGVTQDGRIEDAVVATIEEHAWSKFRVADADADGRTDLLVYGNTEADYFVAPSIGTLTPGDAATRWTLTDAGGAAWVGDHDGDGVQELVVRDDGLLLTLEP